MDSHPILLSSNSLVAFLLCLFQRLNTVFAEKDARLFVLDNGMIVSNNPQQQAASSKSWWDIVKS